MEAAPAETSPEQQQEQPPTEETPQEPPKVEEQPPKQPSAENIQHVKRSSVTLSEDTFGTIFEENGYPRAVKRFIWKNHNNIEVHLITYGARITSIRVPDRKGTVADIVMGFDDLAGYLYYDSHYFGAVLGRVASYVENSTCAINGKQYWFTPNQSPHHYNGGNKGLDKIIWNHHVEGTKVILTHLSLDKEDGYPGDLLVKLIFELTSRNELSIDMEAVSTKATIVNLSMLNYFNLAGHHSGPEEMYKHMLTINANCYTMLNEKGLPKGELQNVNFTQFDFQVPVVLEKVLTDNDDAGYDQNLCINRGSEQANAFVARLLHVPSGRLLEIYSNQSGVQFYTADRLGNGLISTPIGSKTVVDKVSSPFDMVLKLHDKIKDTLEEDKENQYSELRNLIRKLQGLAAEENQPAEEEQAAEMVEEEESKFCHEIHNLKLSPFQLKYLDKMRDITERVESVTDYSEIGRIVNKILEATTEFSGQIEGVEAFLENTKQSIEKLDNISVGKVSAHGSGEKIGGSIRSKEAEDRKKRELEKELKRKGMIIPENTIPTHYKDGRIHGKDGCIYKKHGAVCLQTQNYPNAIYHKNFPSCVLNPGETYRHTIVYKFFKQAGNPNKWIKQYNHDMKKKCVNVSKRSSA